MAELLTLFVDVSGVERKLSFMVDQAKDLDPVLRKYGQSYLRRKVQQRFEQGGGPPLKASTQAKVARAGGRLYGRAAERAAGLLQRKLRRELKRAQRSRHQVDDPILFAREEARQRHLASQGRRSRSMAEVIRSRDAAVERRKRVLAIFEKVLAGDEVSAATSGKGAERAKAKIEERLGRSRKKVEAHLLGKIPGSMKLEVKGGRLVFGSEIDWAWVHELGGDAGHGAKIPARERVYLDDEDMDLLVDMIVAWVGHSVIVG